MSPNKTCHERPALNRSGPNLGPRETSYEDRYYGPSEDPQETGYNDQILRGYHDPPVIDYKKTDS